MSRPETDPAGTAPVGGLALADPTRGSPLLRTFRAFTYRDYRLLWAGAFTSSVGTWMQEVAQNWLILTMTGSAFLLGLDAFLGDAPFLAFSLLGGVLADRVDRRRILLSSQVVQLSSAFLLAGLIWGHAIHVWIILTLSFVVGLAQSFGGPAYQALVPTLVDREDLPNAVALNSIQFNLARVVGPVLAGIAFYKLGAAACFGLNGLSFLAVIAALVALKRGALEKRVEKPEPFSESLKVGLRAVRDAGALRGLIGLAFVGSFCAMPLVTFLPVFAREVFHRDAKGYSGLLAAFGIGAVAGAIGIAGFGHVHRKGIVAVAMQSAFGALMVAFAVSRNTALSYAILFAAGAALMIVFAMFMTLVQTHVSDHLRGRVVSVYSLAFRGAMPLGNLVAGALASLLTAPRVLILDGVVLMLVGSAVLVRHARSGVTSL
ncbi:MAG TPA: MFS transporter [Thermoanaerobaculia bacterium]|nr:MFS transporter [Thermoanaerobaculia bacterium]